MIITFTFTAHSISEVQIPTTAAVVHVSSKLLTLY